MMNWPTKAFVKSWHSRSKGLDIREKCLGIEAGRNQCISYSYLHRNRFVSVESVVLCAICNLHHRPTTYDVRNGELPLRIEMFHS